MEFVEGATFAGYRIERRLGAGGMGTVFLAQHPRLPRKDALKILSTEGVGERDFRGRFLSEAEVAARLDHPNLVTIRDRGEEDGRLWIAMQFVDGLDLAELVRLQPLGLDRVAHIMTEAAQGLDEIHRAGLVHRDVKPANILVAAQQVGPDRVLITDFGIARPATDLTVPHQGGLTATLAYAAPEQISGGHVDHRADVYALGCTLYHLLTGGPPFPRDSHGAILYAHLNEPPPRPSARNTTLPNGFDAVIAAAMAKNPADRYASCGELAAAVRAVMAGGKAAAPQRAAQRRRRRLIMAGAVVAVIVALSVAWFAVVDHEGPGTSAVRGHPPVTGTTEPTEWADLGYVALAFPDLLPPTPRGAGYQELSTCSSFDEKGDLTQYQASGAMAMIVCQGNLDPVWTVELTCRTDREAIAPGLPLALVEGDEEWTRPSGSGHLFWGKDTLKVPGAILDGREVGILEVYFNDASRKFCRVQVIGYGSSGAALRADWWADAPL